MMEDNRFNRRIKNLTIGGFTIACTRICPGIRAEIPSSGMAFYHPEAAEADFQFKIDAVEPDNSGKLLFGSEDFMIPTFLWRRDSGCYDWITKQRDRTPGLAFRISPDWREFTLWRDETGSNGERAFHEFGSLFSYAVLNHDACVLHGVVMEYEGGGILVTAPAGTGKTTHTRMWRDMENALILNGDRCLCRKVDGVWYAYGMPWSGSSGEYINRRVKIGAIVALERGEENRVERMTAFPGALCLMQRIFAPVWQCRMQEEAFRLAEELATRIPVLKLFCRPEPESVQVLKRAVLSLEEA